MGITFNTVPHVRTFLHLKIYVLFTPRNLCYYITKINILTCSVIESREDVASSNTRMGDPFKIALAIATLCFSPPDSFNPRSPT